jgi:phage shock protein PspC (stress-responsive transcriptional regulator)
MNKTYNINLGGLVYHIDDNAYELLDKYLNNLRAHFKKEEGGEEIVHDIELRISELFSERLNDRKQVITMSDVEEIIAQVGKLEELTGEKEETVESEEEKPIKRLYRDTEHKVFGGVCSGLAAYFDWDVTLVRLMVLLISFFVQGAVLAYIIAWMVIPQAMTASEKLSMRGMKVNVENIGKTVTHEHGREGDDLQAQAPKSTLLKIGEGIVKVCTFLIYFLLISLAVIFIPVIFVVLTICFAFVLAGLGLFASIPSIIWEMVPAQALPAIQAMPMTQLSLLSLSGILAIGIPVFALIHGFTQEKPMSVVARLILFILWLAAIVYGIVMLNTFPF